MNKNIVKVEMLKDISLFLDIYSNWTNPGKTITQEFSDNERSIFLDRLMRMINYEQERQKMNKKKSYDRRQLTLF